MPAREKQHTGCQPLSATGSALREENPAGENDGWNDVWYEGFDLGRVEHGATASRTVRALTAKCGQRS